MCAACQAVSQRRKHPALRSAECSCAVRSNGQQERKWQSFGTLAALASPGVMLEGTIDVCFIFPYESGTRYGVKTLGEKRFG